MSAGGAALSRRPTGIDAVVSKGASNVRAHIGALRAAKAEGGLFERQWVPAPAPPSGAGGAAGPSIKLMQFNMLAEGLSSRPSDTPPFPAEEESSCGGFSNVPEGVFDFAERKFFILEKVLAVDPDIVALQECDHFYDFFEPALAAEGYGGFFCEKSPSPCLGFGYYSDGVALFFKRSVFTASSTEGVTRHDDVNCAHAVVDLLHVASQTRIVVGATHLKSKVSEENENKRLRQLQGLDAALRRVAEGGGGAPAHVVVLGDFNTAPHSEGGVEARAVPFFQTGTPFGFRSAYPMDLPYTTCKVRGVKRTQHTIDYIWLSRGCSAVSVLEVPRIEELDPNVLLPCERHPSDHFDLAAVVTFSKL